jgi:hypothetical protein
MNRLSQVANFLYGAGSAALFWGLIFTLKGYLKAADILGWITIFTYVLGFGLDYLNARLGNNTNNIMCNNRGGLGGVNDQ